MDQFRRDDMGGYNPTQIRASAFSKPLLSSTATLLTSPRSNGVGGLSGTTGTSDVIDTHLLRPHVGGATGGTGSIDIHPLRVHVTPVAEFDPPPITVTATATHTVVDATTVTPTTLTSSSTSGTTKDCLPGAGEGSPKYRECLRNHAASVGGHVLDGCGDFMPAAAGGGDAMKCAACGCHRSFHRKEVEGEMNYFAQYRDGSSSSHRHAAGRGRMPLLLPPPPLHHHPPVQQQQWQTRSPAAAAAAAAAAAFGGNYSGSGGATTESSSEENPGGAPPAAAEMAARKRFRSKFTVEQKKRMLAFAESVGWRMQKQDEAVAERFCSDVGIRRQVLKVWMHNNKHTLKKHHHDHQQQNQNQNPQQQQQLQNQQLNHNHQQQQQQQHQQSQIQQQPLQHQQQQNQHPQHHLQ